MQLLVTLPSSVDIMWLYYVSATLTSRRWWDLLQLWAKQTLSPLSCFCWDVLSQHQEMKLRYNPIISVKLLVRVIPNNNYASQDNGARMCTLSSLIIKIVQQVWNYCSGSIFLEILRWYDTTFSREPSILWKKHGERNSVFFVLGHCLLHWLNQAFTLPQRR